MKTCTVCHIEKNLADFYQRSRSLLHIPANLQVIPSAENKRKAAKFIQVDS